MCSIRTRLTEKPTTVIQNADRIHADRQLFSKVQGNSACSLFQSPTDILLNAGYRIYSNKPSGAYFFQRLVGAGLIRMRGLLKCGAYFVHHGEKTRHYFKMLKLVFIARIHPASAREREDCVKHRTEHRCTWKGLGGVCPPLNLSEEGQNFRPSLKNRPEALKICIFGLIIRYFRPKFA